MKAPSRRSSEDSLEIVISPSANSCTCACTAKLALHQPQSRAACGREGCSCSYTEGMYDASVHMAARGRRLVHAHRAAFEQDPHLYADVLIT